MKPRSFIEYLKRLWPYRQRASADAIQRVMLYRYQ
jgi:hypothetical protein